MIDVHATLDEAFSLLPPAMDSREARVLVVAICLQESRFEARRQIGGGPARGFPQFELGSRLWGGGVWGVYKHRASRFWLARLCEARGVPFEARAIYEAIEHDDVLALGLARLLIFTDPHRLPAIGDEDAAWSLYADRCWRPGKPHPETWHRCYLRAMRFVSGATKEL